MVPANAVIMRGGPPVQRRQGDARQGAASALASLQVAMAGGVPGGANAGKGWLSQGGDSMKPCKGDCAKAVVGTNATSRTRKRNTAG